jgi:hypothetical protein
VKTSLDQRVRRTAPHKEILIGMLGIVHANFDQWTIVTKEETAHG